MHTPIDILYATSECAPLIKTGGLADVSKDLTNALTGAGQHVRILMPAYSSVLRELQRRDISVEAIARTQLLHHEVTLLECTAPEIASTLWLLHSPELFDRDGGPYQAINGEPFADNALRFAVFCRAIAWIARGALARRFLPQVVHLNDWQTALAAAYLNDDWPRAGILFSIHNLAYQGVFAGDTLARLDLHPRHWHANALEFYGQLSFIKAGLVFADTLVTVSPTYAQEIQSAAHGEGLQGLLQHRRNDLHGIVNGIDTKQWDPEHDPALASPYGAANPQNKRLNTEALRREFKLPHSPLPLLGSIGRLAEQKGVDILLAALPALMQQGLQVIVLGAGDPRYAQALQRASASYPQQFVFINGFEEALSHRIEAGADLFLMPSRYEPCGLNQMFSLRYGTLPIARRTGGLADTVEPVVVSGRATRGNGFLFDDPTPDALLAAIQQAMVLWHQPDRWRQAQHNAMAADFSWQRSMQHYLALYRTLAARDHGAAP